MKKETIRGLICLAIIVGIVVAPFIYLELTRVDTTQLAKDEFSKYYNGKDEVVLNIEDNLYFENHILERESLNPKNSYGSIVIYEESIYYLSFETSKMGFKSDSINVYSCDFFGNSIERVYSQELNIYSNVDTGIYKDNFYIKYKKDKLVYIDKYTISTGIYENIASGKNCNLSDYVPKEEQSRYSIEVIENISPQEHGKFIVTDLETGVVKTIDDDYLKETIYIKSMEKFNYGPERVDISNGHILLTYGIGAGDGWNFPHLVFEYDFDSNKLEYKLLVFPYDSVPIEIIYIG